MALDPVLLLFLFLGTALGVGYLAHLVFRKHRISDVFFLLFVGVAAGPIFHIIDPAVIAPAIPFLAPIALVIVLFEGGLELAWDDIRRYAGRATAMALATWCLTAVGVAFVAHLMFHLSPILALLFGFCVAATGMLVVIPLLAHLRAPPEARVILTVETSLGDLLSAVVVTTVAGMLVLGTSPWEGAALLGSRFIIGSAVGLLAGIAWARILHSLSAERHGYPLTLAALLVAYAASEALGGSGYLMALAFGLFVGNAPALIRLGGLRSLAPLPSSMRLHQSEFIFLLRSMYFLFLGLTIPRDLLTPSFLLAGVAILGAMVLARIIAVTLTAARRTPRQTRFLLIGMMPRGLATAVIAGIPMTMGVPGTQNFLAYTFLVIVMADIATSIGLFVAERAKANPTPGSETEPAPVAQ